MIKNRNAYALCLFTALAAASGLWSCTTDEPVVNLGIADNYRIARMQKLSLSPALTGEAYCWRVNGAVVSDSRDYIFVAAEEGVYDLSLEIIDPSAPCFFEFKVNVFHEEVEYSPYIATVLEYCPAPGQLVNEMPQYSPGDTYEDMCKKAQDCISGTNGELITLGGFGGYVTFGFDHTVMNLPGADFRIWGNAFYGATDSDRKGGSAEPGIVMVSFDANCNGIPDDQWFELAGSEHANPATRRNYSITYSRPSDGHEAVRDGFLTDIHYIPWTDSDGASGFIAKNSFHEQDYFPAWVDGNTISFTGTLLPPNGVDISGTGSNYILYSYDWGYADNHPNDCADLNSFDISWAVDADGNRADLPGVDFIRVYTALNQYCGWLGESSTEISRAQDLHIKDIY
ncbi:MAG: cell surface protein [Muribaculaceae bacterium]|nr:cell surface protein [Muribaculaceae bacterium]